MERLAFCNRGGWNIVPGHLGTEMALSDLTRRDKALADAEFGLTWEDLRFLGIPKLIDFGRLIDC